MGRKIVKKTSTFLNKDQMSENKEKDTKMKNGAEE